MSRWLILLTALATTCLLAACVAPGRHESEFGINAKASPPNVIIILADDLGYADVGCFGAKGFKTPAIDRMAEQGLRMTSFYSGSPICSPTRASLLTGCYPSRVGCGAGVFWPDSDDGLNPDEITIAELLKARGYATACVGKWHLGHRAPFLPTSHGFDSYFGIPYSNDMGRYDQYGRVGAPQYYRVRKRGCELYRDEKVIEESPDQRLLTRRYTQEAVAFIEAHAGEPFFLYLAHAMPHLPLFVSSDFEGSSERGLYGDVVQELDWSVGEVLAALKRTGVERNTLVIFTSDNGPWLEYGELAGSAGPLRGGKGTTWEGGQRVPFIARWPRLIPPGTATDKVASTIDLLPTIAALAGTTPPTDRVIDGRDLSSLFADPNADTPDTPFFYFSSGTDGVAELEAVRLGHWKYHAGKSHGWNVDEDGPFKPCLYDLTADISEHNIATNAAELVEQLEDFMTGMEQSLEDASRPLGQLTVATDQ